MRVVELRIIHDDKAEGVKVITLDVLNKEILEKCISLQIKEYKDNDSGIGLDLIQIYNKEDMIKVVNEATYKKVETTVKNFNKYVESLISESEKNLKAELVEEIEELIKTDVSRITNGLIQLNSELDEVQTVLEDKLNQLKKMNV